MKIPLGNAIDAAFADSANFSKVIMASIDEDLHSRQIWTYGLEAMHRMASTSVAVVGLNGLGAEVAKNLILANMQRVLLLDDCATTISDLSSQFYLSELDIGRNRAHACRDRLQQLNPAVSVTSHDVDHSSLTALLATCTAVVLCDFPLVEAEKLNVFCREHSPPVRFIMAQACGLCFRVFSDFGNQFTYTAVDTPYSLPILSIECPTPQTATIHITLESPMMSAPSDGDTVVLSGIEGAVQLNGLQLMVRTDHKPRYEHPPNSGKWHMKFHVTLPDTRVAAYTSRGQVTQVVLPQTASFDPLSLCLAAPGKQSMMFFFKEKWTSLAPAQLHVAFAAFNALSKAQPGSRLRAPPSPNDFLAACRAVHAALPPHSKDLYGELNEDAMRTFCRTCFGNLNPISAVAGGIAAQEAIKACSQKFPPMCDPQFLYFDALDAAPDDSDTSPQNSRYDGQLAVFGQRVQEVLEGLNVFLVGAGALGCEILKNFALMGVGCGQHGRVVVTDNDHIEKSNLSRQFLFRSHHIGKSKSACAAESVAAINGSLRVSAVDLLACKDTESFFNDVFWNGVHLAANALDNFKAREYVSSRCLRFAKPLLECGTQGLQFSSSVYLPHITAPYVGGSDDDPGAAVPICTIKEFPTNAQHCLMFAKSEFIMEFTNVPIFTKSVLQNKEKPADSESLLILERIAYSMTNLSSFEQCLSWARLLYDEHMFRTQTLTLEHPENEITDTGKFWTPPKRFPSITAFDSSDPLARNFVHSAAILKAKTCGIAVPDDVGPSPFKLAKVDLQQVPICYAAERSHKLALKMVEVASADGGVNVEEIKSRQIELEAKHAAFKETEALKILAALTHPSEKDVSISNFQSIDFNKDDAAHIIRMRSYGILPELDRLSALRIVGNSIPAVATSTAIAAGLTCIDLYKIAANFAVCSASSFTQHDSKQFDALRSTFSHNHAHSAYNEYRREDAPSPASLDSAYQRLGSAKWTVWDSWRITGSPTVADVYAFLRGKGVDVLQIHGINFAGGSTAAFELPLSPQDLPIARLLHSRPDYADKMRGKMHIELQVSLSDSIRIGVGAASGHVQLADAETPWTVLGIKQHVADIHGVDWALDSQTTCHFSGCAAVIRQQDVNAITVPSGVVLTLVPPTRCWVQHFPILLLEPYTPPEAVRESSISKEGLTVVVSSPGETDVEIQLRPPADCTVTMLKTLLQQEHGVSWAVESSRCLTQTSKPLKDDVVVPTTGRLKLRKT